MSTKITCQNPECHHNNREILYSSVLRKLLCFVCAVGARNYKAISCKRCSKKHGDAFGNLHEFYFESIRAPTSMEFYCSDCAKIVREQNSFSPFGSKKCQSSLHQTRDNNKRLAPSSVDGKIRCIVCETQLLKPEIELRENKLVLEKKKVNCQSINHQKVDDDKTVAASKQDGKNRCVVCELNYTQILLENEKLKRHN